MKLTDSKSPNNNLSPAGPESDLRSPVEAPVAPNRDPALQNTHIEGKWKSKRTQWQ